jgi:predicted amidophosphoribosyltransferase
VLDPARDLLLGTHCLGCASPGRLVCAGCAQALVVEPFRCWPTPSPAGLVEPWAATSYAGLARDLVIGLKERRLLPLVVPLSGLLAAAVEAAVETLVGADRLEGTTGTGDPVPWLLVPVPSRRATVRARGHDAVGAVVAAAAQRLRSRGHLVDAASLLRLRPGVVDQSGLDAGARHQNLAGSMTVPGAGLRRLARGHDRVRVLVCDDVVTTGSTLREAQRALECVGLVVRAGVCVAATPRRLPPRS